MQKLNFVPLGAIFDVDDTLLDNHHDSPESNLHTRSRLAALHAIAAEQGLPDLAAITARECYDSFMTAPVHTVEGGVWNVLHLRGIITDPTFDPDHPLVVLVSARKHELHELILRNEGEPLPGAVEFVRSLTEHFQLDGKLAVASTALRRDIDVFFAKSGLGAVFPENKIIAKGSFTQPKPDPEVFNLAFKTLGLANSRRRQVLAFEDDPRGIASAQGAGLFVCAITTRYSREALMALPVAPDVVADSYVEFADIFGVAPGV